MSILNIIEQARCIHSLSPLMIPEESHLLGQVLPGFSKMSFITIPNIFKLLRSVYIPMHGIMCIHFLPFWLFSLKIRYYLMISMVADDFDFLKIDIKSEKSPFGIIR